MSESLWKTMKKPKLPDQRTQRILDAAEKLMDKK